MRNPQISVVIPSFNQGQYIERTLLSILKQNYDGKIQVIVSDGGSTDNTVEILKKYDNLITWWSEEDNGYADAVNKGFKIAQGEIFAIQSSDDYYLKDSFSNIAGSFSLHPDASLICGREVLQNPDGSMFKGYVLPELINPGSFLLDYPFPGIFQHTTFLRRHFFEQSGGLRPEFDMCADADLFYRLLHFANGYFLDRYIAVYQRHDSQRTRTQTLKFERQLLDMVLECKNNPAYRKLFDISEKDFTRFKTFVTLFYLQYENKEEAYFKAQGLINNPEIDERTRALARQILNSDISEREKTFSFNSYKVFRILVHLYRKYLFNGIRLPEKGILVSIRDEVNGDWWKN